jgi:Icc-related predicted phosphoesterase
MRRCWESGPKGAGGLEGDKPENGLTLSPNSGEIPGIHPMKAALFSDVHGHLRVLLHLIRNWQIAHATHLDAALIAGDLGCFPDPSKFDRATKRWIVRDPEEAGFAKYFTTPLAEVERLFEPEFGEFSAIRCPIVFVPGNHEDYGYIESASKKAPAPNAPENTFPVDCYKRFHCLRDGAFTTLLGEDSVRLRVAGIWGIENARKDAPYQIKNSTVQQLRTQGQTFDLLLTHDAPAEGYPTGGSRLITQVIRACCPEIHLFGHVPPINGIHEYALTGSRTKLFVLKTVSFGMDQSEGLAGAMGILEWNGSRAGTEVVKDDWLQQMYSSNWERTLPECATA